MKKVIFLTLFAVILTMLSFVQAQTIVWVSEWNANESDIPFDQGWIDLLESQGYTVLADTNVRYDVLDTDKINQLNDADLVIISRNTNSGGYIDGGEITQWNSVDSPLILLSGYLTRNNRWQWINSSQVGDYSAEEMMEIVDSGHGIFKGISATDGKVDMIDETVNDGQVTFINSGDAGNGKILARRTGDNYAWIAEWEAGTEFYSGTSQIPTDKRLLFTAGGSAGQESGSLNLTETGKQIFLNAVSYMLGAANNAKPYYPTNNAHDVEYNPILSWIPGIDTETHNVFFGTDYNDVKNATIENPLNVTVSEGHLLDANEFDPNVLEFGQTYYWRVDEVSASTEDLIYVGSVWSFTTEPVALNLPYENFAKVTAISSSGTSDPNDTVNGEGLDPNFPDQHSGSTGSWASSGKDDVNDGIWIQYDFDQQYKIHEMLVWNFNHKLNYRYGFKDVLVQYSADGQAWVDINDVNQFAQADGKSTYVYNTIVDFNDAVVKSVRITAFSNYGSKSFGLSEVRFTYIPVWPRNLAPADGTEDVDFDAMLTWRRGREAIEHHVYIDTDKVAVRDKTVDPIVTEISNYSPTLNLNSTYYWRVDEVNPGKVPSVWGSELMSFSTVSSILVDGFEEGYGDTGTDAVYLTWKDAQELGNKTVNGSIMGRLKKPYLQTIHRSGNYSAPFTFNNTKTTYSEVIADTSKLLNGTDWSIGNPNALVIWFMRDSNDVNDPVLDQMYVKINGGNKIIYDGDFSDILRTTWTKWEVPLDGVNLNYVSSITIGAERIGSTGGKGIIYLDDIYLTLAVNATDPGADNLIALYEMENNALDTSGSGFDGTAFGTVNGGPTYDVGKYGMAMVFDGNDDYVELPIGDMINTLTSCTISSWVNWSGGDNWQRIFDFGKDTNIYMYMTPQNNASTVRFAITTGSNGSENGANTSSNLSTDNWEHVAVVINADNATIKVYRNGDLAATAANVDTFPEDLGVTTHNYIGKSQWDDPAFNGMIDDFRIYDRALSDSEIKYLYKN